MKIAFCTPFKPVNHSSISGDVTIARDLYETVRGFGHELVQLEYYPAKKIYLQPGRWIGAARTFKRMICQAQDADCILTYSSYYKVPDIYGPRIATQLGLPYFIFQASYAENRGKKLATWPGFRLNRTAMLRADHIFHNRMNDVHGCAKLLPQDRYSYVKPGIPDGLFYRDEDARRKLRKEWQVGDTPVIITAAMMRRGVKTKGLHWVIDSCSDLVRNGRDFKLVVAGDGPSREEIEPMAMEKLGDKVQFLGMVDRGKLGGVFSAGDLFAFPGLEESVGMVYLEAQQCGLPVVATDDEGAPYVVAHNQSGIITGVSKDEFTQAMDRLIVDTKLRERLGSQAVPYVEQNHSAQTNYREMVRMMESMVNAQRSGR